MGKNKTIISAFIAVFLSLFIVFMITNNKREVYPNEVYKVYLDGEFLGAIKSKKALEDYIDKEQDKIKKEYEVKKVYIPNGIDIEKAITYDGKILSEKSIYKKIKEAKSFTIKGYAVNISQISDEDTEKKEDITLYMTKKNMFDIAAKAVLDAFVPSEDSKKYETDTQSEIRTTGSIIENIYLNQEVTIKQAYISTDELIFTDENDLTKYLLFGDNSSEETYTIQTGDTIETVAFNNKLSTDEFLIVNPEFTNSKNLLIPGQEVNIALINPLLEIVVERHTVEDVDLPYETIEKDDDTMYVGTTSVETEGVNGVQRITEKIKLINGEIKTVYILPEKEIIKSAVNEVVLKGTKVQQSSTYTGTFTPAVSSGSWCWPTVSPYMLSSYFEWRWGRLHEGLDITGTGFGSPIFAAENGTVISSNSSCDNDGWYGSTCGSGFGNYVWIAHPDNIYIVYAHMMNNVLVYPGQEVTKGQVIGYMGNSGSSTGTHLHFGTFYGGPGSWNGGTVFDPFTLYQ